MTNTIFETVSKQIDTQIKDYLKVNNFARSLYAKTVQLPEGKYNVDYYTAGAMGVGTISYELAQTSLKDTLALTPTTVKVPILRKEFAISRQMLQSMEAGGIDITGQHWKEADYQVARLEELLLLNGFSPDGTNYTTATGGFGALVKGAGLSEATASDFSSGAGYARAKIKLVMAQYAGSSYNITNQNFNLILNPTQYFELMDMHATYSNEPEINDVLRLLNPVTNAPQGRVMMSPDIAATYGLCVPVDPSGRFFDLLSLMERRAVFWEDPNYPTGYNEIRGMVIEALRPRIINSYGITYFSGI